MLLFQSSSECSVCVYVHVGIVCVCVSLCMHCGVREKTGVGGCVGREEEGGGLLKTLPANKQGGGQW